jgi:hypothetical protein
MTFDIHFVKVIRVIETRAGSAIRDDDLIAAMRHAHHACASRPKDITGVAFTCQDGRSNRTNK